MGRIDIPRRREEGKREKAPPIRQGLGGRKASPGNGWSLSDFIRWLLLVLKLVEGIWIALLLHFSLPLSLSLSLSLSVLVCLWCVALQEGQTSPSGVFSLVAAIHHPIPSCQETHSRRLLLAVGASCLYFGKNFFLSSCLGKRSQDVVSVNE